MIVGQNMLADVSGMLYAVCEGQLLAKRVILVRLFDIFVGFAAYTGPKPAGCTTPKTVPR